MEFEDTKLPDHPATRAAFRGASFEAALDFMDEDDSSSDSDGGADSMLLPVRAGEILHETIPQADPEQVAGAMLFLTPAFHDAGLMHMGFADEAPKACAWAQEWRNVQRGDLIGEASVELRQLIVAANISLMEDMKRNFHALDPKELKRDLAERDQILRDSGDIKAPALLKKFEYLRGDIERLVNGDLSVLSSPSSEECATVTEKQRSLKSKAPRHVRFKP